MNLIIDGLKIIPNRRSNMKTAQETGAEQHGTQPLVVFRSWEFAIVEPPRPNSPMIMGLLIYPTNAVIRHTKP